MRHVLLLMLVCSAFVLLLTAASAPARPADDCTWGTSSVMVEEVNGQLVQTEPATAGCIPR